MEILEILISDGLFQAVLRRERFRHSNGADGRRHFASFYGLLR